MEAYHGNYVWLRRISTPTQNIDRQVRNIRAKYPDAVIVLEVYTGTSVIGRKKWRQLTQQVECGDTIVFDSVSRMSRNAEDGFKEYQKLFERGIELVFLKEPMIDTATYKIGLSNQLDMTGTLTDYILQGINQYLMAVAKEQIRLAFAQAEKEVTDLRQRTREGIETARLGGKKIGRESGDKLRSKLAEPAMACIRKHSKAFGGTLTDEECMKVAGISPNTYYKYKRLLFEQLNAQEGAE